MRFVFLTLALAFGLLGCTTVADNSSERAVQETTATKILKTTRTALERFAPETTATDMSRATLVLDVSSICMLSWSHRWWIEDGWLYAGDWRENAERHTGFTIRNKVRITPEQLDGLFARLDWLGRLETGVYDVQFNDGEDQIFLTGSPFYAVDFKSSDGRRIIVGGHPVFEIAPIVDILNAALPVAARIEWSLKQRPYHLQKRGKS